MSFKVSVAKLVAKVGGPFSKFGSGSGKSFAGILFTKIAGIDAISELSKQLGIGSIILTGTNGKTTTTTLLIKLLSTDVPIRSSFESNTINAIASAFIQQKGDIGVFEYGIRNIKYGIPDTVQRVVDPVGVVYTTISQEHTQVAGVKNPFEDYYKAKRLLSQGMKRGVIITNGDDPRTALLGIDKEKDVHVNYYGIETDGIEDINGEAVNCPKCGETLTYSKYYLNHRGIYSCSCGFKRPDLNVKLTDIEFAPDSWKLTIEGDLFNYTVSKNINFNIDITVPPYGFHNIYNTLASITTYASFTPKVENIESTVKKVFNNLDMSFIPPGRFEVVDIGGKFVGLGQGDNGDALKINAMFMNQFVDAPLEFIYTTPDVDEEEIFEDHYKVIKSMNPEHVIVVPGRHSIEKAEEYYNIIKQDFPDAEFYPLSYEEMDVRIEKLNELARNSDYKYVIMTGCGEEQAMWEEIKKKMINR
ncbi:MAG: UDP-N-acetylmuramyl peptide synthase [Methanobrevibacter sp.]|jgi:UDP-N-acetylmuramyl tripeptide synthase|uniref:Mur ligase family protein n=1 Tax=Methanobrevibacter sp. TaxID=66852 RepID=UPI0025EB6025|nr:Mur ligase family protein [Methanobrevibacter sp.]MBE6497141.1 UDP-N-acetylmuramyl peptide synthase [Methanobrevibacter sp.]